ncbi:helix-turn-helix domain-containing protein [Symbiopectobacterium purcellii]|uniref:Helix-turn-helix domain-containing protein n=2 Tax=Symbiopectobacterium purcellii TaxID=2871826 RepID=A0ABX9AH15_9ENTR|nr:helix-turn-helix domain-containing protein [Symbiopectobacterium purcellii]
MQNIAKKRITGLANQTTIAKLVGVRPQAISLWLKNGVPPKKVIRLCGALEWQVTPHELRPDIYPNPTDALPAHREHAA